MLSLLKQTIVNGIAGRCYLCSQNILAECVGSNQSDSSIYTTILKYYTEPCNGQCILFRNTDHSIVRGCSWTYGYMTPKSIGWHEISPGIKVYFCNSHLCNNGTYEQPEISMINKQFILSPQDLFVLTGNNPSLIAKGQYLSHQCYSCTARFQGCGEILDPHYASNYIRPCPSSCIIFRNPNDLNLITRDCSIYWPRVHAKNGLHKLLGSDAFFCQQSLCNGINFDFIIGIFYNQLPVPTNGNILTTTTTTTTTTTIRTTVDIYNDNVIWDDPDLDFIPIESTTIPDVLNHFSSSTPIDHFDFINQISPSSTIVDDLTNVQSNLTLSWSNLNDTSFSTLMSSTLEIDEEDSIISNTTSISLTTRFEHLLDDNDTENNNSEEIDEELIDLKSNINDYSLSSTLTTTTTTSIIEEYIKPLSTFPTSSFSWLLNMTEQNKSQFLNSTITNHKQNVQFLNSTITNHKENVQFLNSTIINHKQNVQFLNSTITNHKENVQFLNSTIINHKQNVQFLDSTITNHKQNVQFLNSTITNHKQNVQFLNSTITNHKQNVQFLNSTITNHKENVQLINTTSKTSNIFYEYCKNKQCYHHGRLNSDCLCICLPAFTGDNCETVLCEQEPTHICAFILEHECQIDYIQYLCPKFCQMNNCSSLEM
ncbi:unnamed protein product [Rotaria sordida]|uniref:EGF-like domain-containing protein n=1 Tax=Rotaria sordida TaxID=392033 RepID=A0A818QWD0_9BILA|nr:unnamed protein product [Rotaria sordida]CAF3647278.1 unnamed protein product [Rotaria sordida]